MPLAFFLGRKTRRDFPRDRYIPRDLSSTETETTGTAAKPPRRDRRLLFLAFLSIRRGKENNRDHLEYARARALVILSDSRFTTQLRA